jgi:hypothetical protein
MMRVAILALVATLLPAPALADTLIDDVNGIAIGTDGAVVRFTGLLVGDDGRVAQVLQRGDKRPAKVDYLVKGEGRTLIPGMIDAHGHVMELGFAAMTLDLSVAKSLPEAQALIAAYAKAHPDRPWIIGRGWNQETWGLGRMHSPPPGLPARPAIRRAVISSGSQQAEANPQAC